MRRLILLLISSCAVLFVTAQEEIIFDSIPKKSAQTKEFQPVMEKQLMFHETVFPEEINSLDNSLFFKPTLPDYNKNLDLKRYLIPSNGVSYSFLTGSSFIPGFPFGHVFTQSTYQLNKRLLVGGNSFGARSVFELPKLNTSIRDMNIRGASIFMQYKVSDHFRVETRINISNQSSSPWAP